MIKSQNKSCLIFFKWNILKESFKNKKINKLGINREECIYFTSMNSRIIIFLASLEK